MTLPVYPVVDFERGSQLLSTLGSFWTDYFADADKLQAFLRFQGWQEGQILNRFSETAASYSRFTVPIFRTRNWYCLRLQKSKMNSVTWKYGDPIVYGRQPDSSQPVYGGSEQATFYEFSIPSDMVDAPYQILNRVINPSLTLIGGLDYDIDRELGVIRFLSNPFESGLISQRAVYDSTGNIIDTELQLWMYKTQWDGNDIYTQYGYVMDIQLPSSVEYRNLLNAYWDMRVAGPSANAIMRFLSALSGIPLIQNESETIQVVTQNSENALVITDKNVYKFTLGTALYATPGQVVHRGQSLTQALQLFDMRSPTALSMPALTMGQNFIDAKLRGSLTFVNQEVTVDSIGSDVYFPVGGSPEDVASFWSAVFAKCAAEGRTFASYLGDVVPSTINPMRFVIENFFKNNLFIIALDPRAFSSNAPGMSYLDLLRSVLPPNITYLLIDLSRPTSATASEPLLWYCWTVTSYSRAEGSSSSEE